MPPLPALRAAVGCLAFVVAAIATHSPGTAYGAVGMVYEYGPGIYTAQADGTSRSALPGVDTSRGAVHPALSPDGNQIVYIQYASPHRVMVVNADGSNPRTVATSVYAPYSARFSPTGTSVVVGMPNAAGTTADLYQVGIDGSNPKRLTTTTDRDELWGAFHPNATKIAYSSCGAPGYSCTIHVANADGSSPQPLVVADGGVTLDARSPWFSPGGDAIAFNGRKGNCMPNIYTVKLDGTQLTNLTNFACVEPPDAGESAEDTSWGPDGTILYTYHPGPSTDPPCGLIREAVSGMTLIGNGPCTTSESIGEAAFRQSRAASVPPAPPPPPPSDQTLAARFRPQLLFDTSERWRPLKVADFFGERTSTGAGRHKVCPSLKQLSKCRAITTPEELRTYYGADAFVDIDGTGSETSYQSPYAECRVNGLRDCDTGARSGIYWHAVSPSPRGYKYFDYWFFYRYNYFDSVTGHNHEGDWEGYAVAPSADGSTFDFASFSQHTGWFSYLRESLSCDGVSGSGTCGTEYGKLGTRVSVFVANGSHANYATACSETVYGDCTQQGILGVPERGHDGAAPWGRNSDDPTSTLVQFPPAVGWSTPSTANWVDWPGRWGKPGEGGANGPKSPGTQDRFKTPWNAGCFHVTGGCPAQTATAAAAKTRREPTACSDWFGAGVAVVACDERALRRAIRTRALGESVPAAVHVRARRGAGASAPGVTQVMGRPLRDGEQLSMPANGRAYPELLVRAYDRENRRIVLATFDQSTLQSAARASSRRPRRLTVRTGPRGAVALVSGRRVLRPTRVRVAAVRRGG